MNGNEISVSWVLAFLAGVVSFLSPCVLPLIPGYVSMVSKLSFDELTDTSYQGKTSKIIIPSIFFVLGFSFVFILLGASASFIGTYIQEHKRLLLQISGATIIVFGLFSMEIIKIPQLYRDRKFNFNIGNLGLIGIFLLGIAFGFGWTPCVGPILASILLYASTSNNTLEGAFLLFIYSLGLGLPFLITGLALSKSLSAFGWIKRHYNIYKIIVGGTLVVVGILMLTNTLFYLNIYGQQFLDLIGIDFWKRF